MGSQTAILTHLLGLARPNAASTADGSASCAFASAAVQLRVLAAAAGLREARTWDLSEELVERVKALISGKQSTAGKQLGLQLLHSLASQCDRGTFLLHHNDWTATLCALVRAQHQQLLAAQWQGDASAGTGSSKAAAVAVAEAAWACLEAVFQRYAAMLDVPGIRRDASSAAVKLGNLLLQQQQQQQQQPRAQRQGQAEGGDSTEPVAALAPAPPPPAALGALVAALAAVPAALRQQQQQLEALLSRLALQPASSSASGGTGADPALLSPTQRLAVAALAALPRIAGSGEAWSALAQRAMVAVHTLLDVAYCQVEDAALVQAAKAALDPSAAPLPHLAAPAVPGAAVSDEQFAAGFPQLGALLLLLQRLLGGAYPAAVPIPSRGLLLLASRVLAVDDASAAGRAAASSRRFMSLCLQLPALHTSTLRLLRQLVAAAGGQLVPLCHGAARLLAQHLQATGAALCAGSSGPASLLPLSAQMRYELYGAAQQLLQSAGVGAVRPLAPALLKAAAAELYGQQQQGSSGGSAVTEGPSRKKAKKGKQAALDDPELAVGIVAADDVGAAASRDDLAAQVAMLRALCTLLATGAPLLPSHERSQVDDLAAHMAATAATGAEKAGMEAEGGSAGSSGVWRVQAAAYRLLLASVLAPLPHRPPHLTLALRLFRAGRSTGSRELAAFCSHALLCCEALLHPRAPPPAAVAQAGAPTAVPGSMNGQADGDAAAPLGMPRFWSSVDAALLLEQQQKQQLQLLAERQQQLLRLQEAAAEHTRKRKQQEPADAYHQLQEQVEAEAMVAAAVMKPAGAAAAAAAAAAAGTADVAMADALAAAAAQAAPLPPPQLLPTMPALLQPAAQPPQQLHQQQKLSVAATMFMSGSAPAPPAVGSDLLAAAPLPLLPGSAAGAEMPAAPAVAAPAAAVLLRSGSRGDAGAEDDEDSEGSLPDIDSGGEGSSSGSDGSSSDEE